MVTEFRITKSCLVLISCVTIKRINQYLWCRQDTAINKRKSSHVSTQYNCMNIISKTISVINPNQTPVDTCDQPVYALTKQTQWRYPELFGNSKYFSLFGGLHIEKALLIVHGEFIKGSGLDKLLGQSNLSITDKENSVVNVTEIKRCI